MTRRLAVSGRPPKPPGSPRRSSTSSCLSPSNLPPNNVSLDIVSSRSRSLTTKGTKWYDVRMSRKPSGLQKRRPGCGAMTDLPARHQEAQSSGSCQSVESNGALESTSPTPMAQSANSAVTGIAENTLIQKAHTFDCSDLKSNEGANNLRSALSFQQQVAANHTDETGNPCVKEVIGVTTLREANVRFDEDTSGFEVNEDGQVESVGTKSTQSTESSKGLDAVDPLQNEINVDLLSVADDASTVSDSVASQGTDRQESILSTCKVAVMVDPKPPSAEAAEEAVNCPVSNIHRRDIPVVSPREEASQKPIVWVQLMPKKTSVANAIQVTQSSSVPAKTVETTRETTQPSAVQAETAGVFEEEIASLASSFWQYSEDTLSLAGSKISLGSFSSDQKSSASQASKVKHEKRRGIDSLINFWSNNGLRASSRTSKNHFKKYTNHSTAGASLPLPAKTRSSQIRAPSGKSEAPRGSRTELYAEAAAEPVPNIVVPKDSGSCSGRSATARMRAAKGEDPREIRMVLSELSMDSSF